MLCVVMASDRKDVRSPSSSKVPTSPDDSSDDLDAWRKEMLHALQNTAAPEPIRVACIKSVPTRPSFFGEEFHGKVSRDEVEILLGGVNGRFLVRESISSPGDYIISFSYGGNILHYKLFYDDQFYTESDNRRYNSLTDLMMDVLQLLREIDRQYGGIPDTGVKKEKKNSGKPHSFKVHNYMSPKWCDYCGDFLWGLKAQGMKCHNCGLNFHTKCVRNATNQCGKSTGQTHTVKKERRSVSIPKEVHLCASLFQETLCRYQESCLKILETLKLPAIHFDVNAMNPCYCTKCAGDVDVPLCKSGEPAQVYSLPLGWCRFRIALPDDINFEMLNTWNVGYLSVSFDELTAILQGGMQKIKSDLVKITPSILCADLDAPKKEFQIPEKEHTDNAQVAIQVYIKPGSYAIMGRAGGSDQIDQYFKNERLYWATRQTQDIIPFGLLVKKVESPFKSIGGSDLHIEIKEDSSS